MVSPEGRHKVLEAFAQEYLENHLLHAKHVNLPPRVRWSIAKCALSAPISCKGCQSLNGLCLRPSTRLFITLRNLQHEPFLADLPTAHHASQTRAEASSKDLKIEETSDASASLKSFTLEMATILQNMVHAVINHQARLDHPWHQDTIQALLDCGMVDYCADHAELTDEEKSLESPYRVYAIFAEIALVAILTHSIHSYYLLIGETMPNLPPMPSQDTTHKTGATKKDDDGTTVSNKPFFWHKAKHSFAKLKRDPKCAQWGPFFHLWDLNYFGREFQTKLSSRAQRRELIWPIHFPLGPFHGLGLAAIDILKYAEAGWLFYLPIMRLVNPLAQPDTKTRCGVACGLNRYDYEAAVVAVTQANNCGF